MTSGRGTGLSAGTVSDHDSHRAVSSCSAWWMAASTTDSCQTATSVKHCVTCIGRERDDDGSSTAAHQCQPAASTCLLLRHDAVGAT